MHGFTGMVTMVTLKLTPFKFHGRAHCCWCFNYAGGLIWGSPELRGFDVVWADSYWYNNYVGALFSQTGCMIVGCMGMDSLQRSPGHTT